MSNAPVPKSILRRSYLGIGSCCLFLIAAGCVIAVIAANWHAEHKLAGLEIIVVFPFAISLNLVGALMAYAGTRRRAENPLSQVGLALNAVPLMIAAFLIVGAISAEIGSRR
jgi:uncharacterized membrane protein